MPLKKRSLLSLEVIHTPKEQIHKMPNNLVNNL